MPLVPPVGAGATAAQWAQPLTPVKGPDETKSSGTDFGSAVGKALDDLQSQQTRTDELARDAATGKLQNIEDYLMTATETQLATQLTVAVRNKAVEAFNEIMRMQI